MQAGHEGSALRIDIYKDSHRSLYVAVKAEAAPPPRIGEREFDWRHFKTVDLRRDEPLIGLSNEEARSAIEKVGFYAFEVKVVINESTSPR
ncbi:MAG TPA: hypothetical protein VJP77_05095 [Planctomycetota bacterium]|nr:hypothetical protein [Planctomycetota bacterium]